MTVVDYIVVGILLHLVADWLFQNEWMAVNKVMRRRSGKSLVDGSPVNGPWWDRHPAAWVHAGIHTLIQVPLFGPFALLVGFLHLIVDTRTPLTKWKHAFKQTIEGPYAIHVAIWQDQVVHFVVIATVALLIAL